jgi:CDP-diacylglycerol--serine O-phosphatidyltransferase
MWGITVAVGLLMVSNVRYYSFKTINLRHRVPFVAVLVIVLILVLISSNPPVVLFAGFLVYALSGPVLTLIQLRRRRAERMQAHQQDEPENTEDLEKS